MTANDQYFEANKDLWN